MSVTKIEWCDATWNPVRGCKRVSPGCENCYAERTAARFNGAGLPYEGLTRRNKAGRWVWTGRARDVSDMLTRPLSWRRRAFERIQGGERRYRVFVNSMSDLFHEDVSFEFIASVFGVMAACPDIDFMVLTKRPARMLEWYRWADDHSRLKFFDDSRRPEHDRRVSVALEYLGRQIGSLLFQEHVSLMWPLPNVHVGVSCEDQQRADERIPLLLECPAAVRWVSAEPLLAPLDLERFLSVYDMHGEPSGPRCDSSGDWVVVGGESGPRSRPCDITWMESIVGQCSEAGVPAFVKQLGSGADAPGGGRMQPISRSSMRRWTFADKKGADMSEWPESLRVRELPEAR